METLSANFNSILLKYKKHKLQSYKVAELLGTDYTFNDLGADTLDSRYKALINCGTQLEFTKNLEGGKTVYHLKGANFCRQRCCPMCQFRRSEKMFAEVLRVVKHLERRYRFIHLVLTIPNCTDGRELVEGIKLLYKGFSNLLAYKSVNGAFKGILRCLEVSYNYDNDTFHPHLHCLVAVNKSYFNDTKAYLSYDKLRALWSQSVFKAVGQLPYDFDFMAGCPELLQIHIGSINEGDVGGVAEVCKYCVKPLEFENETNDNIRDMQNKRILLTLWHTLKGVRFVQKYGVIRDAFRELRIDDDNLIDEESTEINAPKLRLDWDFNELNYKGVKC